MAIVPFSVILLICLLPFAWTTNYPLSYNLKLKLNGTRLEQNVMLSYYTTVTTNVIEMPLGEYKFISGQEFSTYKEEPKNRTLYFTIVDGKAFLATQQKTRPKYDLGFKMQVELDLDELQDGSLTRKYGPGNFSYLVTTFLDLRSQQAFPIFSRLTDGTLSVDFSMEIITSGQEPEIFFTKNPQIALRQLYEKGRTFLPVDIESLKHFHFLVANVVLAAVHDGTSNSFQVYCRDAVKESNILLYESLGHKVHSAFKFMEKLIGQEHPVNEINVIVLPKLSENVTDANGIIYFDEAQINQYTLPVETYELVAEKVVHQFLGWLGIEDQEIFKFRSGLLNLLKYEYSDELKDYYIPHKIANRVHRVKSRLEEMFNLAWDNDDPSLSITERCRGVQEKFGSRFRLLYEGNRVNEQVLSAIRKYFTGKRPLPPVESEICKNATSTRQRIFEEWGSRRSYPVITVKYLSKIKSVALIPRDFFYHKKSQNPDPWYLAFDMKCLTSVYPRWYTISEYSNMYPICTSSKYVINEAWNGFYRVNYEHDHWDSLIKKLNFEHKTLLFKPEARAQLIDDAFNLARTGHLKYGRPLSLLQYTAEEQCLIVWEAIYINMRHLRNLGKDRSVDGFHEAFGQFVTAKIKPLLTNRTDSRRNIAIKLACLAEIEPCKQNSSEPYTADEGLLNMNGDIFVGCTSARANSTFSTVHDFLMDENQINFTTRYYYINILPCFEFNNSVQTDVLKSLFQSNSTLFADYERYKAAEYFIEFASDRVLETLLTVLNIVVTENENMKINVVKAWIMAMVHRLPGTTLHAYENLIKKAEEVNVLSKNNMERIKLILDEAKKWNETYSNTVKSFLKNPPYVFGGVG